MFFCSILSFVVFKTLQLILLCNNFLAQYLVILPGHVTIIPMQMKILACVYTPECILDFVPISTGPEQA